MIRLLTSARDRASARLQREANRIGFLLRTYDWEIPSSYLELSPDERGDIARLIRRRAEALGASIDLREEIMKPEALQQARAEQRELIAVADLVEALEQQSAPRRTRRTN